jgi:hypothetical protein
VLWTIEQSVDTAVVFENYLIRPSSDHGYEVLVIRVWLSEESTDPLYFGMLASSIKEIVKHDKPHE